MRPECTVTPGVSFYVAQPRHVCARAELNVCIGMVTGNRKADDRLVNI